MHKSDRLCWPLCLLQLRLIKDIISLKKARKVPIQVLGFLQLEQLVVLSQLEDRVFLKERIVDPWKLVADGGQNQLSV